MAPQLIATLRPQIEAALARRQRPQIRRRLLAIRAILAGETNIAAARKAGVDPISVRQWRQRVQDGDCSSLLANKARAQQPFPLNLTADEIAAFRHEIDACLSSQPRLSARRRLIAVREILSGKTLAAAARHAKASPESARRWFGQLRQGGAAALASFRRRRRQQHTMAPSELPRARQAITDFLAHHPKSKHHVRLKAVELALAGKLEQAAATALVRPQTVESWLRPLRRLGITEYLRQCEPAPRPRKLDAEPEMLRALASHEKNRHIRKRILALAYLAEGFSVDDAAVRVHLSTDTVRDSLRRFQQGGIADVRSNPYRGPSPKLRPDELQAVAAVARAAPMLTAEQLCKRIETDYGVHYTTKGLINMLKKQLGIVHPAPGAPLG